MRPRDLDGEEVARVMIARALALRPRLLVVDEPTIGVDLGARDSVLQLIRSIADSGIAVLMSTGETPCMSGAERALTMSKGALRGELTPSLATVVPLTHGAQPAA
jgi:ABC-type sugar transport system ATPase subunit